MRIPEQIANWGNYPSVKAISHEPRDLETLQQLLRERPQLIPRGLGRCYGDGSLGREVLSTLGMNRILEFNPQTGIIRCESGVSLDEILVKTVPFGWFIPVTPGTKLITIGGALAADVHGKNHHVDGTIANHTLRFSLLDAEGNIQEVSPEQDLFWQTCGGMGLTGIVLEASIQLKKIESSYINQKGLKARNLDELLRYFNETQDYTYSVAWLDCLAKGNSLGRSILLLGEHTRLQELPSKFRKNPLALHKNPKLFVPFFLPDFTLNSLSIKLFNAAIYNKQFRKELDTVLHYDPYFYPLDAVKNWNRAYGKSGFFQYQMVLPRNSQGEEGLKLLLHELAKNKTGSFLSVLKVFGKGHDKRYLSFPEEGYTLALDIKYDSKVLRVMDAMDDIVLQKGGKIYLAKDARLKREKFEQMYKNRLSSNYFRSLQSERLGMNPGTPPPMKQETPSARWALILGANSDMARACLPALAKDGQNLYLAVRNPDSCKELAAQLQQQYNIKAIPVAFDAEKPETHAAFYKQLPHPPSWVLCAFGYLGEQKTGELDWNEAQRILSTNFNGAVSILEIIAKDLEFRKEGTIIGISSVAGERGRQSNYLYGAAKAGFTAYLSGLRNRLQSKGVHVLTVKPGFVRTKMTLGLPLPAPLTATPEQVASAILKAAAKKKNVIYVLPVWRLVMAVIRNIPEGIFKKLKL